MTRRRIAIVTPWYGPEATGGAETLAREFAEHLSQTDDVTILTTTARSFLADWSDNYFKPGHALENGYAVLRFPVSDRDAGDFHRVNGDLMQLPREQWHNLTLSRIRTDAFIEQSINSPQLEKHLRGKEAARYDAVVFLPYLYGVVVRGIEAYPGRAHLLPCLHDEAYARLPRIEDAIHRAATLLFNSEGEAELALRLYGPGIMHKSHVIGTGVALGGNVNGATGFDGPYFLFLGRRDQTKGVNFLIEAFAQYRDRSSAEYSLVLAGPGTASYHDPRRGIIDLGFVDEAQKMALIKKARALAQPSVNESYSRVMMEAWRENVPVIARGECLATATAVRRSGGGVVAEGVSAWADAFALLEATPAIELEELGQRGAAYAALYADWSQVINRFHQATGLSDAKPAMYHGKRIDQVVETMAYGDAISDYAQSLRSRFRTLGHDGKIYARVIHPHLVDDTEHLRPEPIAASAALVYHHSIAFENIEMILSARAPKALIYHNITPSHFFREFNPVFADRLQQGREQLASLAASFTTCAADSEFNARELHELGFRDVAVLPVPVNFTRFDTTPTAILRATGAQWLFVGRVSPNKGLRLLIEAFEVHACLDPAARLVVVGGYNPGDRYYLELMAIIRERSLEENVVFAGVVDEATLTAHYRSADVYVCLSEHEGFCVPLVEAMYFDVPVVASANTAIVETMGDAGILLDSGAGALEVAAVVREVCNDHGLRERIIESQRRRRAAFHPDAILPQVDAFLGRLA